MKSKYLVFATLAGVVAGATMVLAAKYVGDYLADYDDEDDEDDDCVSEDDGVTCHCSLPKCNFKCSGIKSGDEKVGKANCTEDGFECNGVCTCHDGTYRCEGHVVCTGECVD